MIVMKTNIEVMPKNCRKCDYISICYPKGMLYIPTDIIKSLDLNTRPNNCPLIEIEDKQEDILTSKKTITREDHNKLKALQVLYPDVKTIKFDAFYPIVKISNQELGLDNMVELHNIFFPNLTEEASIYYKQHKYRHITYTISQLLSRQIKN